VIATGRLLLGLAFLAAWHAAHLALGADWISAPVAVARRAVAVAGSGELLRHTLATLTESATGFIIGAVAGIALPFVLRLSPRLGTALEPLFAAALGVPKLALAPLLILWFGLGLASKVALVASVVFFLLLFNTEAGIRAIDQRLAAAVRVLGASQWIVTREIAWHTALPHVFAGLKLALPRSLSAAVVGELIAADRGLGYYIGNAGAMADTVGVFTGVSLVTLLVVALDVGLGRLEARSLSWRPLARDIGV